MDSYLDLLNAKDRFPGDVTFAVGSTKEKISCHKLILAARSPVFETMFAGRWASGSGDRIIDLPDVEPKIFQIFLEYLYAGKTSESEEVVVDDISDIEMLMYLTDKYNVSNLMNKFEELLRQKLGVNNVLKIHSVADRFHLPGLGSSAARIATSKLSELILDPSFELMNKDLLQTCVKNCPKIKEIDLFMALMKWAEARCQESGNQIVGLNIRKRLRGILLHIRFPRMTIQEFRYLVIPRKILNAKEQLDVYDHLARDASGRSEYRTGIFNSLPRLSASVKFSSTPRHSGVPTAIIDISD